ncbi:MAG: SHOCT domain-containing protein [Ilumatobacteraceae bacterium]
MREAPLLQFKSHVGGKSADVRVLTSRVEWVVAGRHRVTEVLPVSAIHSVVIKRDGVKWKLLAFTDGSIVEFRVDRSVAEAARDQLVRLITAATTTRELAPVTSGLQPIDKGGIADELITLKWLLDAGVLTEHDFQEERARLLGF